jgi:carbonic anhydrase
VKTIEVTYRYDVEGETVRPRPKDAHAACERLDNGSVAFASLVSSLTEEVGTARRIIAVDPRDLGLLAEESPVKQRPYAAVLGCSDARVPIELIFNEGPNDLFVVRVAGNGLGSEVLGSLQYALDHLSDSLKLVVVLGHSGCGAVSAAVDVYLKPHTYLGHAADHDVRGILDRLLAVVHKSAQRICAATPDAARRPGYRQALIEASVVMNAALTAFSLQQSLGGTETNSVPATFGVYLLASREVWAPRAGGDCKGLAYAPRSPAGFDQLGDAVIGSERIAGILDVGSR